MVKYEPLREPILNETPDARAVCVVMRTQPVRAERVVKLSARLGGLAPFASPEVLPLRVGW